MQLSIPLTRHPYPIPSTLYSLLSTLCCLAVLVSCTPSEDALTPSGNYSVLRFDFPQGDKDYDMTLKQIHDTYGVYILYKDITLPDLNRKWTSLGTDFTYYGEDVPEEHRPFYVDFMHHHVFDNITVGMAQKVLPVRIYMLHNFRGVRNSGVGNEITDPDEVGADGVSPNFRSTRFDGFDYWAISFRPSEVTNNSAKALKIRRCALLYQIILKAYQMGLIAEPEHLMDGIDLNTPFDYFPERPEAGMTRANHPCKRGFVWYLYPEFDSSQNRGQLEYYSISLKNGVIQSGYEDNTFFLNYIKAAMYYTPEEFFEKYPPQNLTLVKSKYEMVVEYMKETYGIDLQNIAYGPGNKE